MLHSRNSQVHPALIAILLCISPVVVALDFETGVGVGMGYTDNAALTSTNEKDDWIAEAAVGATISQDTGSLSARADAAFSHQKYIDDTFGDQDYFDLSAIAGWEQIRDRLTWNLRDYFTQTPIDSLDPDTPNNNQNANVFSFGPDIFFQATPRNSITISPLFQDYYYEDDQTDNQQYGVTAGWLYKMYPTMAVGLDGGVTQVSYEDEDLNPDYTISTLQGVISGTRPRAQYTAKLGATHIDRDRFDNNNGFSGSLDWLYNFTGRSSVRVFALSELTDASSDFFNSAVDPGTGDFDNEQVSGDVLQNNTARLTYRREGDSLNTEIWTELRDLDYKESPDDRKVQDYGIGLGYRITPLLTTGVDGQYTRTEQTDVDRTDKEYSVGGIIAYQLTRKLRCDLNVRYRDKNSTQSIDEFNEFSVFAGIVYGVGRLRGFTSDYR
jgi:hypothetical protein